MDQTYEDLKAAFAGESQASRKYYHFSVMADQEGFPQVARLFRAAAMAETIHAGNHLKAMDGVKSTKDNLQEAIAGEHYEHTEMYPGFLVNSEAGENRKATRSFKYAMEVEKIHEELYQKALDTSGQRFHQPGILCLPDLRTYPLGKTHQCLPDLRFPGREIHQDRLSFFD